MRAGIDISSMTLIARARATPEDTQPIRLPGVWSRHLSDVKHLWKLSTWKNQPVVANAESVFMGGVALEYFQFPAFLLPTPVAPLVYPQANSMGPTEISWMQWYFLPKLSATYMGVNPSQLNIAASELQGSFGIPLFQTVPAGEPSELTVPSAFEYIEPFVTANASALFDAPPLLPAGWTRVNPPQEVLSTPTFRSATNTAYYALNHGNSLTLYVTHLDSTGTPQVMPVGGGVTIALTLLRYNGLEPETSSPVITLVVPAGSSAARMDLTKGDAGKLLANAGYYRFRINLIQLQAPTTGNFIYGALQFVVGTKIMGTNDRVWVQPTTEVFRDASYLFRRCRVNAAALRIKNTTPALQAGGDGLAGLCSSQQAGWFNQNPESLLQAAGAVRTGYRGNALDGLYTWMPLTEGDDEYLDHTSEFGTLSTPYPTIHLDRTLNPHFGYFDVGSVGGAGTSVFTAQLRADTHIEYISTSPLANNGVSSLNVEDLSRANMILAAAPLAYSNPMHLPTIWNAIKKAGALALKSGASAVARAALEAMLV